MVMSIIILLAAVAVPSLMGTKDAAEKASLIVTLRSMHTDQVAYHTVNARYARLGELNTFAGSLYGRLWGTALLRREWIFTQTPTPTDFTLKTQYNTLAYRMRGGRISSAYTIGQDGQPRTLIP